MYLFIYYFFETLYITTSLTIRICVLYTHIIYILFFSGRHYSLPYPYNEFKTGRNLRMSPIYPKLKEAGAVFEQVMGYERPSWFEPDLAKG